MICPICSGSRSNTIEDPMGAGSGFDTEITVPCTACDGTGRVEPTSEMIGYAVESFGWFLGAHVTSNDIAGVERVGREIKQTLAGLPDAAGMDLSRLLSDARAYYVCLAAGAVYVGRAAR